MLECVSIASAAFACRCSFCRLFNVGAKDDEDEDEEEDDDDNDDDDNTLSLLA